MRADAVVALALALGASGCAIGGSSSVVGRWRAQRVVDSTACVQVQAPGGGCEKLITIGRDVPARRFQALWFVFPATGYMQARGGGEVSHGLALQSHFEYVRGRGGRALGVRLGAEVGDGFGSRLLFLTPVSVVGHLGRAWGSVYAGAGYSPVATEQPVGDMNTAGPVTWRHNSVHAFVGTRIWLSRTLERGFTVSPELRVETFGDAVLTSLTANIGIHL